MRYTKEQIERILRNEGFNSADTESVLNYLDEYDSFDNKVDFSGPEEVVADFLEYAQ